MAPSRSNIYIAPMEFERKYYTPPGKMGSQSKPGAEQISVQDLKEWIYRISGYSLENPPRMDKTIFSARKQP